MGEEMKEPERSPREFDFSGIRLKDAVITTEDVHAWFDKKPALKGISLSIAQGMVTAVIGPSGCGKSTFIRILNRMHEVVPGAGLRGRVFFEGQDIYSPEVNPIMVRKKIGMVFQKPNPFPMMSIKQNVTSGFSLQGIRAAHIDERVENSLKQAALWDEVKDDLSKPGSSLSGGQQQRLCIARALAVDPSVLLMDEPCSALDPIATAKIEDLIHSLRSRYTIVIVTHNMQQAARVADYTAFFYLGELIEYNKTDTIFKNPNLRRTEDYITGRFG